MNRKPVNKISNISRVRKVLARQHVSPDGLVTRFESFPFVQAPLGIVSKDHSDDTDLVSSHYILVPVKICESKH